MHPTIAVCIFAPLLLPGDLVYNRLIWVRTAQIVGVGVVPTPGNAKELAHPANRILFSMTIDYRIFCSSSHSLSVDRRKSRSSSFSIFRLWTAENPAAAHSPFSGVRSHICILQCLAPGLRLFWVVPWVLGELPLQVFAAFDCIGKEIPAFPYV